MLSTGKGTMRKKPTINEYEKELDAIYVAANVDAGKSRALVDSRSPCVGEILEFFLLDIFLPASRGKEHYSSR